MDKKVLRTRSLTALIFAVVVVGCLLGGKFSALALLAVIGIGSCSEYLRMTQKYAVEQIIYFCLLFVLGGIFLTLKEVPVSTIILMVYGHLLYVFLAIVQFWWPVLPHKTFDKLHVILYTMLPVWIAIYATCWLAPTPAFILYTLMLIWISDSGAYFVGSLWGKNKLFERLSPKKTWEGFIGAGVLTILSGWLFSLWMTELSLQQWLLLAFWSWMIGTIGDLYESFIKRTFRVKDSGRFMPGHGGFLDRFDSFLFVISFSVWLIWIWK